MAPLLIGLVLINIISLGVILAFVAFETQILAGRGRHTWRLPSLHLTARRALKSRRRAGGYRP